MNEIQVGEAEKEEEEKSLSEQLRTVADHVEDLQEVRLTMSLTMLWTMLLTMLLTML